LDYKSIVAALNEWIKIDCYSLNLFLVYLHGSEVKLILKATI